MKQTKRVLAVIMALAMVLTMAGAAYAAPYNPDEEAKLIIHKLAVDADMTLNYEMTGKVIPDGTVIGTDDNGNVTLDSLQPVVGAKFKITLMKLKDGAKEGSNDATDYEADTTFTPQELTTGADGTITFGESGGIPHGVYLVQETALPAGVSSKTDDFLVSVPMTDPANGTDWIYEVHVYPKNVMDDDEPSIEKKVKDADGNYVDETSVSHGDTVSWKIAVEIPADIATSKKYIIKDELDSRLAYKENSISVYYLDADGDPVYITAPADFAFSSTGGVLTLTFDATQRAALADALDGDYEGGTPELYVEFDTTIVDMTPGVIDNEAELAYTNTYGKEYEPDDTAKITLFGLRIVKVDSKDNTILLEGAKFKLYGSEADAKSGNNPISAATNPDFMTDPETEDPEIKNEFETDTDGNILAFGLAKGTYWLVETQAPVDSDTGKTYNLLKKPVEITLTEGSDGQNVTYIVETTVENSKGFELPMTGGLGTLMFTLVGAAMMAAAGVLVFKSRKQRGAAK